jgi:GxxExxY protein
MDNNSQNKVVYPELSYKIVGCLFEVYKELGSDRREKFYQAAVKEEFTSKEIKFKEQVCIPLEYKGVKIANDFLDFLVEDKIILELKVEPYFRKQHLKQTLDYLKATKLKLGIIANFTKKGVKFYRVLNIN